MIEIQPYEPNLRLIDRFTYEYRQFDSYDDVLKELENEFSENHVRFHFHTINNIYYLTTEFGDIVDWQTFLDNVRRTRKRKFFYADHYKFTYRFVETRDKQAYYRIFRKIRTTAERRWYDPDVREYNVKIRGRRSASSLPTSWDDIHNSSHSNKGWKRARCKKQWEFKLKYGKK